MRLSIDPTDLGFKIYRDLKIGGIAVRIFLNGEEQKDVVTVDTSEGWLCRYRKVGPTQYVVQGDCLSTEVVYGDIQVETGMKSSALN